MMGSCTANHWMIRQMCIDEKELMVWVSSELPHGRQKGASTRVAYLVKRVCYLKNNSCWGQFKN